VLHLDHLKSISCVFRCVYYRALQLTDSSCRSLNKVNEWDGNVVPSFWVNLKDCLLLRDSIGIFPAKSSCQSFLNLQVFFQGGIQVLVGLFKFLFECFLELLCLLV